MSTIKARTFRRSLTIALAVLAILMCKHKLDAQQFDLKYRSAPIDNPLKGLVPYAGKGDQFPHSMEFSYFPIRELMTGPSEFDWSSVELKLDAAKSRGCQMVIRVYLETPGKKSGMPDFLKEQGVEIIQYQNNKQPIYTPDYSDPKLIAAMKNFIAAFGNKYDADPRVGFITMGVLGYWGEWHTHPRGELFASKGVQTEVMNAFETAFKTTKVLMRYPAGVDHWRLASNHERPFGFHDDSFGWGTLDTGKKADEWFFEPSLKAAGAKALDKWKTQPIGGEIRPEIWGCVFDTPSCAPNGQKFEECASVTHASWLMDSGIFSSKKKPTPRARLAEAKRQVQRMGYELHVQHASISQHAGPVTLKLAVENRGVAPFYYNWPIEVAAFDLQGNRIATKQTNWKLTDTLPDSAITWTTKLDLPSGVAPTLDIQLAIKVVNPMPGGKPFRFANETQQADGWLLVQP